MDQRSPAGCPGLLCDDSSVTRDRHQAEGQYTWPRTLVLSARPPKLVYLDINHWIGFAKAHTGHRDGERLRPILDACIGAAACGEAVFPISDAIYAEIVQITQHRQRRDLREVIELLSGFRVITS